MATVLSFFAWVQDGLRSLKPGDISAAGTELSPPQEGEEVVGTLEGDLLKTWALIHKSGREMLVEVETHDQKHRAGIEHVTTECAVIRKRLELATNQASLLKNMFWYDVRAAHGLRDCSEIGLRAGMKVVRCPDKPEESEIDISVVLSQLLRRRMG